MSVFALLVLTLSMGVATASTAVGAVALVRMRNSAHRARLEAEARRVRELAAPPSGETPPTIRPPSDDELLQIALREIEAETYEYRSFLTGLGAQLSALGESADKQTIERCRQELRERNSKFLAQQDQTTQQFESQPIAGIEGGELGDALRGAVDTHSQVLRLANQCLDELDCEEAATETLAQVMTEASRLSLVTRELQTSLADCSELPPGNPLVASESSSDRRHKLRIAYPYVQRIAPLADGSLPAKGAFQSVRCSDISQGGFSFLAPVPPPVSELVIALGNRAPHNYLTARVVHLTQLEPRGQYMVGCEFTGRATY